MFKDRDKFEILIIGGSAGSFPVVSRILESLPSTFPLPIVMCLHRLKDKREGFKEALEIKSSLPIEEPNDKDYIQSGRVYIAPANYHLLIEGNRFALSTTELVQYSRPSIDVLFESAADSFGSKVLAIILSGANRDGALGMKRVNDKNGTSIAQDPKECSMSTMPMAAIEASKIDYQLNIPEIIDFIRKLS